MFKLEICFSPFFVFDGGVTYTIITVSAGEQTRKADLIQEDRLVSQIHFVLRQNELVGFVHQACLGACSWCVFVFTVL